jgi:hypothetical protein
VLIDKYLETYHYNASYERLINVPAKDCFIAAKHLDITPSFFTRLLLRLRRLPYKDASLQEFIKSMCFTYIEEDLYREFVIDASQQGISIYWNFYFTEISPAQTKVRTETRIYCLSPGIKRRFAVYWFFIKPFSGLIRKELLKMIEKKAGL